MSTWWRHPVPGAVMMAAILAVPAAAQEQEPGNFPGWSFTPGASVGWLFDSNVAISDAPASTGQTTGDQLFVIQPFGQLEFHSPRTNFNGGYSGFIRRYSDVKQLDGFDQRANVSVQRAVTRRLTLMATDTFLQAPTTDEIELNGVPFSRRGSRTNSASVSATGRLTKFTDLNVRYDNTWVAFDPEEDTGLEPGEPTVPDAVLTGGLLHGVRVGLSRRINERTGVGGDYAIRRADINNGTRQLTFQDVGATLGYEREHTTFTMAAGISHISDDLVDVTRTGPFVRLGITRDLARATLGASFERVFVPSFGFGGSNESQEVRGFVRMPLSRNRLYVQASAAWRRSDPLVETELQLDTIWARSSLGYAVARWLRVESYYVFTRQDSIILGGEINRYRAGFQTVIAQPMRIR